MITGKGQTYYERKSISGEITLEIRRSCGNGCVIFKAKEILVLVLHEENGKLIKFCDPPTESKFLVSIPLQLNCPQGLMGVVFKAHF